MGTTSIERCLSKALDILTVRPSRKTMVLVALLMLQATAFFGAGNIVAKDITGKVTSATNHSLVLLSKWKGRKEEQSPTSTETTRLRPTTVRHSCSHI